MNRYLYLIFSTKNLFYLYVQVVGIFEILSGGKKYPSGTGWMLSEDLVVTNQHVAEVFCEKVDGKYQVKAGFEKTGYWEYRIKKVN